MPSKKTLERAKKARREGKAPSTQAGEFIREEMEDIRKGKHGARSTKQAIAIGLSKARRAGVPLKPPPPGRLSKKSQKSAESAYKKGQQGVPVSKKRSKAGIKALKKEPRSAASSLAISRQVKASARKKTAAERSRTAQKAAKTRRVTKRRKLTKKGTSMR